MISLLYVDDEPDLLDLCKLFLEREGEFSVATVTSAREGLQILTEGMIDAIVSDYQMPGMDGIEFLKQVRMEFKDIPFILFTGKGREEVVIEAIENGADFYLQKGGDPRAQFSELSHKIRQAFRRKKAEEELRMMKATVSNAAEGILWINEYGGITFFNDTICSMLGYSREEFSTAHHTGYQSTVYRQPFRFSLARDEQEEISHRSGHPPEKRWLTYPGGNSSQLYRIWASGICFCIRAGYYGPKTR